MNADERTPGQQGYGQQSSQQSDQQRQPTDQQQQQQPLGQQQGQTTSQDQQDGSASSGQASYGNSGDTDTLSQNSSSLGQESDIGQSGGSSGNDSSLFSGSDSDMGSGGSGSMSGGDDPRESADQQFADQGQGAMNEDQFGSDGTDDIEIERSQGRESDIEGSSL